MHNIVKECEDNIRKNIDCTHGLMYRYSEVKNIDFIHESFKPIIFNQFPQCQHLLLGSFQYVHINYKDVKLNYQNFVFLDNNHNVSCTAR